MDEMTRITLIRMQERSLDKGYIISIAKNTKLQLPM